MLHRGEEGEEDLRSHGRSSISTGRARVTGLSRLGFGCRAHGRSPYPPRSRAKTAAMDRFSEPATPPEGEPIDVRRRRLRFRAWHRGTREADLLIGSFADQHLTTFDAIQLDQFEAILAHSDPDIYTWMSGGEAVPSDLDTPVMAMMKVHTFDTPRGG